MRNTEENHDDRSNRVDPDGPSRSAEGYQLVRTGRCGLRSRLDRQPVGGAANPAVDASGSQVVATFAGHRGPVLAQCVLVILSAPRWAQGRGLGKG